MRRAGLAGRRSRAQAGLLATILLLAAIIVATVGATVGYVQSSATSGARDALASAAPTARAVQVQTRLAADAPAQDERVRAVVADDLAGVPVEVGRSVRTEPLPLLVPSSGTTDDAARAVVEADPALPDVADVEGAWPAAAGETALHAGAAEALGVAVGDVLVVDRSASDPEASPGTELTVVGTWRPADGDDPRWFDDPLSVSGVDGSVVGPLVVTPETLDALGTAPFVRWTVVPDAARVVPADLATLAAGAGSLRADLRDDDAVAVRGLTVSGELATTATEARSMLRAASAVTLVPVALLVVVSVVALVQVARLLAQTRSGEVGLLVARGASPRQLTVVSGAEAAVTVCAGALLGGAAAVLVLGTQTAGAREVAVPWLVAAAGAVVGTGLVTGVAGLQARAVARLRQTDRSGRARSAAALGTLVLALVAAGLCLWQLLRYGSPVVVTGGETQVDVLAVLAPAAVLVALAILATAVLGPLGAVAERVAARGRRLTATLAARQVARRLVVVAVPVVLVVLAAGSGTLAGAYSGTTQSLRTSVAELRTGADVRVTTDGPVTVSGTANPPVVARYAALDGATGASSVLDLAGVLGEDPLAVLALDADAVVGPAGPAALTSGLRDDAADRGAPLPEGTERLALDVTAAVRPSVDVTAGQTYYWYDVHQDRTLRAVAWVVDEAGAVSQVPLGELSVTYAPDVDADVTATPTSHTLAGDLPGPGTWVLAAVDVVVGTPVMEAEATVTLDAATATTPEGEQDVALDDAWAPLTTLVRAERAEVEAAEPAGFSAALRTDGLPLALRLLPGGDDAPAPVPVTVPAPLAERYDLAAGDESVLTTAGVDVPVRVAEVVDVIPGAVDRTAVLADQGTLLQHLLRVLQAVPRADEVWLGASDPAAREDLAAAALDLARAEGGTDPSVEVAGAEAGPDASAPVRVAFWLAAAGAVVLALAGVLAVALALLRTRRAEVMVLRALGTPPGAQSRGRALELLTVTATSVVLGVGAGTLVAVLTVPPLARATLGDAAEVLPVPLGTSLAPTALLLGLLVAGLVGVAGVVAARVRRQALDAEYREEIR